MPKVLKLQKIVDVLGRYLSWHHVAIRLRKESSDELELVAFNQPGLVDDEEHKKIEKHFNKTISSIEQGLSGWAVKTGEFIRARNVKEHPQYVDTHPDIQSGMYAPLKLRDAVIGCISVESESKDAFSERDERLLVTLAAQAAVSFENARLYLNVQQELHERQRAETALRESEKLLRDIAANYPNSYLSIIENDLTVGFTSGEEYLFPSGA